MSAEMMNFDPTIRAAVSGAGAATAGVGAGTATSSRPRAAAGSGATAAFEGFLKKAGHMLGVALADIVKYALPIAQVVAVTSPATAPVIEAFAAAVQLVMTAVLTAQQRWATDGSTANPQKLADVLLTVEQPIVLLFRQAGLSVDTAYVVNLINGVVAILNAQPAVQLPATAA